MPTIGNCQKCLDKRAFIYCYLNKMAPNQLCMNFNKMEKKNRISNE